MANGISAVSITTLSSMTLSIYTIINGLNCRSKLNISFFISIMSDVHIVIVVILIIVLFLIMLILLMLGVIRLSIVMQSRPMMLAIVLGVFMFHIL
jgi:hypothetical protein